VTKDTVIKVQKDGQICLRIVLCYANALTSVVYHQLHNG